MKCDNKTKRIGRFAVNIFDMRQTKMALFISITLSLSNSFASGETAPLSCARLLETLVAQISRVREIRAIFNTPVKVAATWQDADLVTGDTRWQTANAITVNRPGNKYPVTYNRTNRGLDLLTYFYPRAKFDPANMRGKKVLDVAMGGGRFVRELRSAGVEAYGLDIALSSLQMADVYVGKRTLGKNGLLLSPDLGRGHFIQADATHTGLASNQFDVIFSTYSMFEYNLGPSGNSAFLKNVLTELCRIIKVGGVIRISPFFENSTAQYMRELVDQVYGLQIIELQTTGNRLAGSIMYTEIKRIR
jgi:ubiquinone/menaquinone biosynthesis C-methylase UbiE